MSTSAAVVVRGLRKSYGGFEAVRGIDFEIAEGETFALLGPNGAGKSTTIEILEGYRDRSAGEASVLGVDPGTGGTSGNWSDRSNGRGRPSCSPPTTSTRRRSSATAWP